MSSTIITNMVDQVLPNYTFIYNYLKLPKQMGERTFFVSKTHSFYAQKVMNQQANTHSLKEFNQSHESFKQERKPQHNGKAEQLQKYMGEPSLKEYVRSIKDIQEEIDFEGPSLVNRKMRRLRRSNLPKIAYLYQRVMNTCQIQEVEIVNQQEQNHHSCTIKSLDPNANSAVKSISQHNSNCCLTVGQTIVFTKIDMRTFEKILDEGSRLRILKKIKQKQSKTDVFQSKIQAESLFKQLFRLFCLPGLDFILWPSIMLQPIIGSEDLLTNIIRKNIAGIAENTQQTCQIFEHTLKQYLDNIAKYKNSFPAFHPTKVEQELLQRIQQQTKDNANPQQFIVRLLGTSFTLRQRQLVHEWNSFTSIQRDLLISKTPFQGLKTKLNRVIQSLNQYKRLQHARVQKDDCLFQLCIVKIEEAQALCIPLRVTPNSEKDILVRCFASSKPLLEQYIWVDASQLTVNLTLPSHSQSEQKYYGLFSQNLHYFQVLKLIYSDYFCENVSQNRILRSLSPINQREMMVFRQQRCKKCYYLVRNLQEHASCKICLEKFHYDCIKAKGKQRSYAQRNSQRQKVQDSWYCQKCAPCTLCKTSITQVQQALICFSCSSIYHLDCGKIIDKKGRVIKKDLFACESCQKCEICSKSLKNKTFFIEQEKIICSLCLSKLYKQFCHKCKQQIPFSQMIQCRNTLCNKKLHKTCEEPFIKSCDIFNQDDFKCFSCRTSQRRKLMKWVLEQLKVFDQYEYFDDPYYQSIDGYSDIIKDPMCFMIMRSKIMQGLYDTNSYQHFCQDLQLIAKNAMTFNMPRDQAHFRAKILLIVGMQFLKTFKTMLQFTQYDIMTRPIDQVFVRQREAFYKDIYKNFSRYLLNYGQSKPRIEISNHRESEDKQSIFSSRHIITKTLMNSQFRYRFHVQPETIGDLFKMPKIIPAIWSKVTHQLCYYHPQLRQPIIFQCKQCWETYCCSKVCYKHSFCKICRQYGCSCTTRTCQCPELREKQYKLLQKQVFPILQANGLTKLQYTQFHKYCLKCAKGMRRTCYICEKICCFCYERCDECNACYHIFCQNRQRKEKTRSKLYNENLKYQEITQTLDYHNKCGKCRVKGHNINEYKRKLNDATIEIIEKIKKITSNFQTLNNIYIDHGIRLNKNELINMIYNKYEEYQTVLHLFDQKQPFGEQLTMRQGFAEYIEETQRQMLDIFSVNISIDSVRRQRQSEQERDRQYKIKSFKQLQFTNRIGKIMEQSRLYSSNCSIFAMQEGFNQYKPNSTIEDIRHSVLQQHRQTYRDRGWLANSLFQRAQTHFPKSFVTSKDIQAFTTFMNNIYSRYLIDCEQERQNLQSSGKQIIKYLRYKSFYRQATYQHLISSERYESLHEQRKDQNVQMPQKKENLQTYLTAFALKAFQDDKEVLCKGNTYLVSQQENSVIILKRFDKTSYHIQLTKDRERSRWRLKINESKYFISNIQDVYNTLKTIGIRLCNFQDLYTFLGLSLADTNYAESDHFTRWMQQKSFHEMTQHQKKEEVLRIYDKYEWHDNGVFQDKQTKRSYKMKKPNLFYLNKRNNNKPKHKDEEQQEQEKESKPFITLQDLRRQLFPKQIYSGGYFEEQPEVSPFPINDVYIAPSKIDRLGLYVGQDVAKHTTVIEYIGQIVSQSVADLRQLRYKYGCYLFTLGKDLNKKMEIIDATHVGNKARFLNHSCDPNCRAKSMNVQGRNRIMIYTVKEVKKDEELTYDYQFKIESNEHLGCNCGSKLCQGRLN